MNSKDFSTYLIAASYLATKSGQEYVKERLPFEFRFDVELNQSCDNLSDQNFLMYPDDDEQTFENQCIEEVINLLSRRNHIPFWIDINVKSCTNKVTILRLCCSGSYTDNLEKMLYSDRGLGPFGVKSPDLPIGWIDGKKIKLKTK